MVQNGDIEEASTSFWRTGATSFSAINENAKLSIIDPSEQYVEHAAWFI